MRKLKSILCFVLAATFILSVGCKGSSNDTTPENNGAYKRTYKKTNEKLWEAKGQVVVLPDNASDIIEYAGGEFIEIFTRATELSPELTYESDIGTVSADKDYYFIGRTEALKESGIDYSYSLLGDSGVVIKTDGRITYLAGATDKGSLYAVYEFMNASFGYEFYADEVIALSDGSDADRLEFDWVYRPSVANPCMMAGELNTDEQLYYKYRFQNYYQTWVAENSDVYYAHTYFKILDPNKYYSAHKNWYSPDKKNLCLTGDPAMIDEFVKRCEEILAADTEHAYFSLGQEDNFEFCNCDTCTARIAELGGFSSAVMMEFTNKVVKRLNEWLEENQPDRNITFVTFAYNHTKKPPVKKVGKKWVAIDDVVKAEKNISVQYVINMCDYYAPYSASQSITDALDGWQAITDNMTIWEYSTNFENYVDCFDNFGSMAQNVKLLSDHGVDYIVEQAAYNTNTTAFSELRLYLWSKLMWDAKQDVNRLIDDFFYYYYEEAATSVKKYFDDTYKHVDDLVKEKGITVRSGGNECMTKQNWSYSTLSALKNDIVQAYTDIEALKTSNAARYKILYDRIRKQELWVDYYLYRYYPVRLDDSDAFFAQWKSDAKKLGLKMYSEGAYI